MKYFQKSSLYNPLMESVSHTTAMSIPGAITIACLAVVYAFCAVVYQGPFLRGGLLIVGLLLAYLIFSFAPEHARPRKLRRWFVRH